ncbi:MULTISPECIES: WbqC family protein [Bordetella]|uniref:WbmP n=2 Tax=Bordetella parapertussis TaxID=519 RepID=K0M7W9_BORPB|nr:MULTISPECIES: WbqC family protein [Bordetella]ABF72474.1 WbmP [Bordetella parapertussis]KAB1451560.1 WbqC family protein [Bordetella bronchiseptica]KAB1576804.1 WbqC family protein [Bordetella bronchiseptica]KDB59516.1 WbqC-like protein [Bordetella bronchiseptica A1-7]KDB72857.1 WbqC-like protein [Bordetella bronchiseptica B20-10725633]
MMRSNARVCAIHQPNFFPWLGYFDKIVRADVFVLLDDVQYQKTGGNWTNRVQMMIGPASKWVTAPVDRSYSGVRRIREIRFSPVEKDWREKMCRTIVSAYGRAPHFREIFPLIESLVMYRHDFLAEYNINAIKSLCRELGIPEHKLVNSSVFDLASVSTDLLVDLTRAVGAGVYLCGGGAASYQEDHKFADSGIALEYQNFRHPVYPQHGRIEFTPGMSMLDALMETGMAGTRTLLGMA